jgi:hypothetical protein
MNWQLKARTGTRRFAPDLSWYGFSAGWNWRQFSANSLWRDENKSAAKTNPDVMLVSLFNAPPHAPSMLVAERLAVALKQTGSMSFETLVTTVAEELYQQELRNGAAVLDIGLFGSRLFFPEVLGELRAGDGLYWEIKKVREAV